MADTGWKSRPPAMSTEVAVHACERIAEHARAHRLSRIDLILHGGEPLLAGADRLGDIARTLRRALPPHTTATVSLQTNGVLLTEPALTALAAEEIRVGVSLDGGADTHDRHRRFAHGGGSHAHVRRAMRLLTSDSYRHLFAGVLATIDVTAEPIEVYETLLEFRPPAVDFLLPHGNWTTPPPRPVPNSSATPYADWLIAIFDRWFSAPRKETDVRLFTEIIHLLLGGSGRVESVGLSPVGVIVVDTDGSMEQVDTLKSAFDGAATTGLDITRHSFDTALGHPAVAARQIGALALSDTCRSCPVMRACGGGHYPHRYRAGSGFKNPSVYCNDLLRLILHVRRRLVADLMSRTQS